VYDIQTLNLHRKVGDGIALCIGEIILFIELVLLYYRMYQYDSAEQNENN